MTRCRHDFSRRGNNRAAVGVGMPKRRRWSSLDGYKEVSEILSREHPSLKLLLSKSEWEHASVRNYSKLPIECTKCKFVTDTATVASLLNGCAPQCACPRVGGCLPWKSPGGRRRFLCLVETSFPGCYDASGVTSDWWGANVVGANSCVPLVCRKCGHRSTTSHITSLQQGNAPGCFCNGRVFWKSAEGRQRLLTLISERYGETVDVSTMTLAWWERSVLDQASTIEVLCKRCNHRNQTCRIGALAAGDGIGCACNGGIKYASEGGYEYALRLLETVRPRFTCWLSSLDLQSYLDLRINAHTLLEFQCGECGYVSQTCNLNKIQQGETPACFCSGTVPWISHQGFLHFEKMLDLWHGDRIDSTQLTLEWWQDNIVGKDSVVSCLACGVCGHTNLSTRVGTLAAGRTSGVACPCNGSALWKTEQGRARLLALLDPVMYDASVMTAQWWSANITGVYSKLSCICLGCNYLCQNTCIAHVTQSHRMGCQCHKKTEQKLYQWLAEVYGAENVEREIGIIQNPRTGRWLRMDFRVQGGGASTFIELDGNLGHFGLGWQGVEVQDPPLRDRFKEEVALKQSSSVIRLLQQTVWNSRDDRVWQGYLAEALQKAFCIGLDAKVFTPGEVTEYESGIYASLRLDWRTISIGTMRCSSPPQ